MIGDRVGNFQIAALLGKGGMGEVYLAEHIGVGTQVAIKMLLPHVSANEDLVQRFFNEAIAVGKIQHAGIGKIFDSGTHEGRAYLVMEFLPGETLAARIRREGRLPLARVGELGKQMAGVLEAVHKAGITHRDLKPDNIFIVPDDELPSGERIKIVDFGIAKLTGVGGGMTATTSSALGTPAYMSPEQWKNAKQVDWRADAYSLGCLLFEMVAGRVPFIAESIGEACAKHLTEEAPRLSSVVEVPPELDTLIARLLEKSPERRPGSLREIASVLGALGASATHELTAMQAIEPSALPIAGQGATQVSMGPSATTLGGASGQLQATKKKSIVPWIVVGVVIAAAVVLVIVMTRTEVEPVAVAEPNKVEPNKVEPNKVEPNKVEPNKVEPNKVPVTKELPVEPTLLPKPPRPAPRLEPESVTFVTVPPKATVKVDYELKGQTPITVRLSPGRHFMSARSIHNELWQLTLVVTKGQKGERIMYTYPSARPKLELVSAEITNAITKQVQPRIFACRTTKAGQFYPMISVSVDPSGAITELRDTSVTPSERGRCLLDAIRAVKFPPSTKGGRATIPYAGP